MFLNHKPLDLLRMWSFNTLSQISLYAHVLVDAMDSGTVESIEDDTALLGSAIECSSAWSLCFEVWPRNRRLPHKEYKSSRIACWEYVQHGATWWNDTLSTSCPRNTFGLSRKLCGSGSRKRRIFHRRPCKGHANLFVSTSSRESRYNALILRIFTLCNARKMVSGSFLDQTW